jgi:hypothetical protein
VGGRVSFSLEGKDLLRVLKNIAARNSGNISLQGAEFG